MTIPAISTSTWSKSQVASLKECRRKIFFNTSQSDDINQLKKLKNRYLWTGSLVHDAIGELLKLTRQKSPQPNLDEYLAMLREKMREQFKISRDGSGPNRLFEHEYRLALPSEAWAKQWNLVEQSLRWFVSSKWFSRLTALGPECWKAIDEILSFDVGGTKAYVKIDCAIEVGGRFIIMDWKTSTPKDSSQEGLLVAALYAHEVWGAEPQQITASAISLVDGKTFHAYVDEDALMQTHLKIEEEAAVLERAREEMALISSFDQVARAPIDTCLKCSYQKICNV